MKDPKQAANELAKWIDDAKSSELNPMRELADKVENIHKENILNAIKC